MTIKPFYVTRSKALCNAPYLDVFVAGPVRYARPFSPVSDAMGVLAWGRKPSAAQCEAFAARRKLPLIRLEDGFLRSVEPGSASPAYSMVWDDEGIYYDASSPNRLDRLLEVEPTQADNDRANRLKTLWHTGRLSKYNHVREHAPICSSPYVLVVDQTMGDVSISCGKADASSFSSMLDAALEQFPEHRVLVKTHPDVVSGRKTGYLGKRVESRSSRIMVVTDNAHPPTLIEQASAVFCVTSQMGFEALMWHKPVYCFGMPFYAGRGLTHDQLAPPAFRKPVSLPALIYAVFVKYCRYVDPETHAACQPERLFDWMALQRQERERFPEVLYTGHVPRWKRKALQQFLSSSTIVMNKKHCLESGYRLAWGMSHPPSSYPSADTEAVLRVEDGFIRSVGLGADLVQPQSWVFDDLGMYYDASRPSRLEHILQTVEFDSALIKRAQSLMESLKNNAVTKYNTGQASWQRPADTQLVVLVPGQVESDASITYGSPVTRTNLALLKQVRGNYLNAYIIYKPHPDVVAGLRANTESKTTYERYCDVIIDDQDMAYLLTVVDEVHTMTSLTGFEALLRDVKVICYGQPFYSGWGLTIDRLPNTRRTRRLSLPELVAGTLIRYPSYISRASGTHTTVERVVEEIRQDRLLKDPRVGFKQRFKRLLRRPWTF